VWPFPICVTNTLYSAVESAIRKYMAPGAFSGKGQTLGGSNGGGDAAPPIDVLGGLDPQVKTLLAIVGVYLLFWYFSS
jgi:thioredoxin 1